MILFLINRSFLKMIMKK